jgi:hypothetical protein
MLSSHCAQSARLTRSAVKVPVLSLGETWHLFEIATTLYFHIGQAYFERVEYATLEGRTATMSAETPGLQAAGMSAKAQRAATS